MLLLTDFCCVELKVTASAIYRPAPGENPVKFGPNEYTAGSSLTLNCAVEGNSSPLIYEWSVMGNAGTLGCTQCNVNTSSLVVGSPAILSYHAGDYTCSVRETGRPTATNNDTFPVNVLGKYEGLNGKVGTSINCFMFLSSSAQAQGSVSAVPIVVGLQE